MRHFFFKKIRNFQGFNLTEVTIVIVILGFLAAMAMPNLRYAVQKIKNQEAVNALMAIYAEQIDYYRRMGDYAERLEDLDITFSNMELKNFTIPQGLGDDLRQDVLCPSPGRGTNKLSVARVNPKAGGFELLILGDLNYPEDMGKVVCKPCNSTACQKLGFNPDW